MLVRLPTSKSVRAVITILLLFIAAQVTFSRYSNRTGKASDDEVLAFDETGEVYSGKLKHPSVKSTLR